MIDAIIGREAVSGGSEFHAASSDVKESPYFLKLKTVVYITGLHKMGRVDQVTFKTFTYY